jgi:hypothetical protein
VRETSKIRSNNNNGHNNGVYNENERKQGLREESEESLMNE